ncbi:hypothetical protein KY290_034048 [Solanum tuberosum]|uniref:Integrase core domain containing protein n=1 Tax=Solanum tuberosum TaxID=4113 RepID=A0ABQ7U5S4_SOLTU|nr:hypothetical protein KY289_033433 [Solanum tuberosum]KAH0741005.1 hypothetical protein KY290_034048 [Solanum tuberosum]
MHDSFFSKTAVAETSKQAWDILKKEFHGSTKVMTVKLQSLRHDFENSSMKSSESMQSYLSRLLLRSPVIYLIMVFDELMSSLQAHEDRLNASQEKGEDKAFQIKGESSFKGKSEVSNARGYGGRGSFRG